MIRLGTFVLGGSWHAPESDDAAQKLPAKASQSFKVQNKKA
jgi:hypothetical protein